MGIRFTCPNGHRLHVKTFLAGKRGICPQCGAKIDIPSESWSQPQASADSTGVGPVGPVESSAARGGKSTEVGSPSIVISVVDSSVANTPGGEATAPSPPPPTVADSPPSVSSTPNLPPTALQASVDQPFRVTESVEPVLPAVRYVAQRERKRRNQYTFAVLLLLAVMLLAGVLIFVLRRGVRQASGVRSHSASVLEFPWSRHVTAVSDRCFNAHGALVANW